jgi:ABC-type antimicrobial peptide transport system permease subunit
VLRGRPDTFRLIVEPMEQALGIARLRSSHNFVAAMFALFAALAIGMASLGVYGVVAHSVAERRRELGVRIAFGATPRNILNVVLREGNAIALAGIALGLLFTKYDASWLNAFIAEDDEYSALLFAAMGAWLFAVTVFAAMIPAWQATRVDPVEALRSE